MTAPAENGLVIKEYPRYLWAPVDKIDVIRKMLGDRAGDYQEEITGSMCRWRMKDDHT